MHTITPGLLEERALYHAEFPQVGKTEQGEEPSPSISGRGAGASAPPSQAEGLGPGSRQSGLLLLSLPVRSPFTDSMGMGTTGAGAAHREGG